MTQTQWKVGDVAVFVGYSDDTVDPKILQVGERVRIDAFGTDPGSYGVRPVVAEGEPAREGDTVYDDEITSVDEWSARNQPAEKVDEEVQADMEAAAAPNKSKATETVKKLKGKGKTKTEAPVEQAAEAPAEAAPKASTKGKAKQEAAAPKQETLPDVIEVHHSSSVQALLAEKDALAAAKELVERNEETEWTLGGVLAHIQREGIHQTLGYTGKRGFEDYISGELGVKYRKARYLINIYEYFTALGIDETRLAEIGWSKAKELVGKATKENFDKLVDYAKEHTRDQLVEYLKEEEEVDAEEGAGAKAKVTRLTFQLFSDQATTVTRALDEAKKQADTDSASAALEYICGEWSMAAAGAESVTLDEHLEILEARFNVKLRVVREAEDGQTDIEDAAQIEGDSEQESAA